MNSRKFACPHCGQNMEYTEEYSGRKMPCPACRQAITFPGLAPAMARSSLRLARDMPQAAAKPRFSLLAMLGGLRYFINRKAVAVCLLACLFISGALLAASRAHHHTTPPDLPKTIVDESIPVDPPDPPPVASSDSVPVDPPPAPAPAPAPAKPPARQPAQAGQQRGARGGNGGRQAGRQPATRGKTPQRTRPPAANGANN